MNSQLKEYKKLMDMGNKYIELGNTVSFYDMKETMDAWTKARTLFSRAKRVEQHVSKEHHVAELSQAFEACSRIALRIEVGDEIVVDRMIRKVEAISKADDDPQYLTFHLIPDANSRYLKNYASAYDRLYVIGKDQ